MAYYRPESNLRAEWTEEGGAKFWLTYQGRVWQRSAGPYEPITVIEAAALAGVTRSAVYGWIQSGELPAQTLSAEGQTAVIPIILHSFLRARGSV